MSPVPVVAVVAGVAGSVALEFITSAGKPSQRDTAIAVGIGLIPGVGLGIRGSLKLGQKVGAAAHVASKTRKFQEFKLIGQALFLPGTSVYIGTAARLGLAGAVANVALGHAYDAVTSRGGKSSPSATAGRTGDGPPSLSRRTSKSPRFGKKRRRCKHRNKAGKRCLRPAGHSGRHRYQ